MGIGKTSAMLYVAAVILCLYGGPVVVIAPKRVAVNVWPGEIRKFDQFKNIIFLNFSAGNLKTRRSLLRSIGDISKIDMYIVNYENVRWFEERFNINFSLLILDEATRVKKFRLRKGSIRAKSILALRKRSGRVVELTGIPAPNGLMDLWGQLFILDLGKRLGRTLTSFREKWFDAKMLPTHVKYDLKANAVTEISEKLKDICLSIRSEDYFSLEKIIEKDVLVTLPPKIMEKYKYFEKEMYVRLESSSGIDAVNKADLTLKCLQYSGGALYTDELCKMWDEIHKEKIYALESIIEEAGGTPVLVCYHFRHELKRLLNYFSGSEGLRNDAIVDKWNAGEIPVLFVHPGSAGHGLNLQYGGNIIVFYTQWWDFELDSQVVERIGPMRQKQAGFKRNVFRYNIMTENTIDLRVKKAREYKLSIDEALKKETV
jgi:SNF2 family DNA or RNA helicase